MASGFHDSAVMVNHRVLCACDCPEDRTVRPIQTCISVDHGLTELWDVHAHGCLLGEKDTYLE